jgi:hypothetical protein
MSAPPTVTQELQQSQWQALLRQTFRSRWTFAALQALDLLSTLAAFQAGALEVNPLVANLTLHFGRFGGVLLSKMAAVAIAMGVRRLVWVVNIFYAGVVCWNVVVLIILSLKPS